MAGEEVTLAFLVGYVHLVAEGGEVIPADLGESGAAGQLDENILDFTRVLAQHVGRLLQVGLILDELVTVPELQVVVDAIDTGFIDVAAPILKHTLVLVEGAHHCRRFDLFDVVRHVLISFGYDQFMGEELEVFILVQYASDELLAAVFEVLGENVDLVLLCVFQAFVQ